MFFCAVWAYSKGFTSFLKTIVIFDLLASILISILFSYKTSDTIYLDLRNVPVLIGGLYVGVGPLLCIATIIFRGIHGLNIGFYYTLLFYGLLALFLWKIHPLFWGKKPKFRILYSISLSVILNMIILAPLDFLTPAYTLDVWIAYIMIPSLGVGITSSTIEFVMRNLLITQHLVKSKKLEAVEQMGAAISHEIRNPLTAALGFVQLLKENELDSTKRNDYLSIVKEELTSAEKVIEDYLIFSKPSLHSVEELIVSDEIVRMIKILQPLANQSSVLVETMLAKTGSIQGERQKFHQVLFNIMKNAVESMPDGGVLSIETEHISSSIIIRISDTGVGMREEQIERLGEPYYSTKESKGTGLGMMVVYSIVRAFKGTILVNSMVGVGTTFEIRFPHYLKGE